MAELIRTLRWGGNFTKAQLEAENFNATGHPLILKLGQFAFETDTLKGKRGDGATKYSLLSYAFYEGAGPGQTEQPINANPFTYNTGITTYIPKYQVYIKQNIDEYVPWVADTKFKKSTGIITVNVDYTADSYVLVVG